MFLLSKLIHTRLCCFIEGQEASDRVLSGLIQLYQIQQITDYLLTKEEHNFQTLKTEV